MKIREEINKMPIIDSHEHIGSLPSAGISRLVMGFNEDHYPGYELKPTTLFDLILSLVFSFLLQSLGFNSPVKYSSYFEHYKVNYFSLKPEEQKELWESLVPYLLKCRGTGLFMALDIAFKDLYGKSMDDIIKGKFSWYDLSSGITSKYKEGLFKWSSEIFEKSNIRYVIKPVHLSYIVMIDKQVDNYGYALEKEYFKPILRVDELMIPDYPDSEHSWEHINETFDIKIQNLDDIRKMVDKTFQLVVKNNIRAIKQEQAYYRTIDFKYVDEISAKSAFGCTVNDKSHKDLITLQDYIMNLILEKAGQLKLPYQIHTGMANLPHTNPINLRGTIERYNDVKFVLLHCYPYLSEAAYMARSYGNVYLDTAWLALQSPGLLYKALNEWIGFVPYTKICLSGDTFSPEECYGAVKITRDVLAQVLDDKIKKGEIDEELALDIAIALLNGNAAGLYGETV